MPYITREDGEHFVIPSYRDVLTARNKSQLKKDILLLSQSYGEYITLQRKGSLQYEVAFSPDTGYLLGESIWHYFKKPMDMIYCEAIPNTTEAFLVIVKAGSVYLDGSFPVETIPEELIIFLTQQNNFEIYTYGEVPISEKPQEGKFSFEANSVKSFKTLDKPVFPTLPLLKIYQLQLVEPVLKAHGIGVFPTRQLLTTLIVLGVLWMLYSYFTEQKPVEQQQTLVSAAPSNPYQEFDNLLSSPAPEKIVQLFTKDLNLLFTLPGWTPSTILYEKFIMTAKVTSQGGNVAELANWAKNNGAKYDITADGLSVAMPILVGNRLPPSRIYPLKEIIGKFIDDLRTVYPGNHMSIKGVANKGSFAIMTFSVDLNGTTPLLLDLIGRQLKDQPFILQKIALTEQNGTLNGTLTLDALGSQL
jgi:hypothetical protein